MIGLNESGKTTILEALSHFPTNDRAVNSMFGKIDQSDIAHSLVPIQSRGALTGNISITGNVKISDTDKSEIRAILKRISCEIDETRIFDKITVTKSYEFKDGDLVPSKFSSTWGGVNLYLRKTKTSKFKLFNTPGVNAGIFPEDPWLLVVNYIEGKLPNIVYFPNFLVDVPKRVYLKEFANEGVSNKYYRKIFQNILSESGGGFSLTKHVVERIEKARAAGGVGAWIAQFLNGPEKDKVDSVFSRLSVAVTREVLGSWGRIFNRPVSANRVEISWFVEPGTELPYAEIKISDGLSKYHLHERSLGFRWFFSFLLFTRFGGERGRPNLFLFDEPAANLHAKAQAELLSSFDKLVEAGDLVIYSTHSHHMIRPEWLTGAYIVENDAIDYDAEDKGQFSGVLDTNIRVTSYRRFVGENGARISYFQPVLERLQYVEPSLAASLPQLMLEGPSDFYLFQYVLKRSSWDKKIAVLPGGGAGSLDPAISIALSRGYKFVVLLDDDKAGQLGRDRYRARWHLTNEIGTLGDISAPLAGLQLEGLICSDTKIMVAAKFGNNKKTSVQNYLAESAALNADGAIGPKTVTSVLDIIEKVSVKLGI